MTDRAEPIESMEQLAVVWRAMVLDRDDNADVRDLPGLAVRWADCRFAFWNCVTLTEVGADARVTRRRLHEAADIMRSKTHAGFLWVFEELLDEAARVALDPAAERAASSTRSPAPGWPGICCPSANRPTGT